MRISRKTRSGAGHVGREIGIVMIVEQSTQPFAGVFFVVDDEDGGLHWRRNA
jgi:hypothetical protein